MLILGVDVGYRNFGYCLTQINGKPEVLARGTLNLGNTRAWRSLVGKAFDVFETWTTKPGVVAIEELVWYGKRKGVLALAHLAGAVAGYALGQWGAKPLFYQPRDVKAMSRAWPAPEGFTEHEHDSLSLCRLAMGTLPSAGTFPPTRKKANGKSKLVGSKKPAKPSHR